MNFEQNSISRRALVSKFGAGIAGAALTAAVPTEGQAQTTAVPVVDPTTKYPRTSLSSTIPALARACQQDEPTA